MDRLTDKQIEEIRNGGRELRDRLFRNIYERTTAKLIADGVIGGDRLQRDDTKNQQEGKL